MHLAGVLDGHFGGAHAVQRLHAVPRLLEGVEVVLVRGRDLVVRARRLRAPRRLHVVALRHVLQVGRRDPLVGEAVVQVVGRVHHLHALLLQVIIMGGSIREMFIIHCPIR